MHHAFQFFSMNCFYVILVWPFSALYTQYAIIQFSFFYNRQRFVPHKPRTLTIVRDWINKRKEAKTTEAIQWKLGASNGLTMIKFQEKIISSLDCRSVVNDYLSPIWKIPRTVSCTRCEYCAYRRTSWSLLKFNQYKFIIGIIWRQS